MRKKKLSYQESRLFCAHLQAITCSTVFFFLATPMLINKGPSRKHFITKIVSLVVFWHERLITYIVQVLITTLFTKLSPYSLVSGHPYHKLDRQYQRAFMFDDWNQSTKYGHHSSRFTFGFRSAIIRVKVKRNNRKRDALLI